MAPTPCQGDRPNSAVVRRVGVAGVIAALTCTLACCLPAILVVLGVGASAAAGTGHGAHGSAQAGGWFAGLLEVLHRISPGLLIVSIALVAGAFAMRRRALSQRARSDRPDADVCGNGARLRRLDRPLPLDAPVRRGVPGPSGSSRRPARGVGRALRLD